MPLSRSGEDLPPLFVVEYLGVFRKAAYGLRTEFVRNKLRNEGQLAHRTCTDDASDLGGVLGVGVVVVTVLTYSGENDACCRGVGRACSRPIGSGAPIISEVRVVDHYTQRLTPVDQLGEEQAL